MFLLPPPEGLEDAYSRLSSSANSLFDEIGLTPILDALNPDPAMQLAIGATMGAPQPRLGVLSRYRALRESPLWETMGREEQLRALRGMAEPRSPEIEQALNFSRKARESSSRLGWIKELMEGGRKPGWQ